MIPRAVLIAGLCATATPMLSQQMHCATAATQIDMNICAERAWIQADADLNVAYRVARDRMRQTDAVLQPADRGAEVALRDAQRSWIAFRDAACAAEGYAYFGGSIRPLVVTQCLERLTRARTADLRAMTATN